MEHYGTMEFETKKELFAFLSTNKDKLIAQKKAVKKNVDCSIYIEPKIVFDPKMNAKKAEGDMNSQMSNDVLKVVVVINTTNFLDSHGDVHIPGLWNKSLMENKMIMHLQEHEMEFECIISDGNDLKAYTKRFNWSELGYSYPGTTEALMFDSTILKKRNPFMFDQYANKWVRNHSVGMYYVKVDIAINDENCPNEFEAWKKYYPQIANSEVVDQKGYFWYVLEAKCIEGSAVPLGSNTCTPTMSVEGANGTIIKCSNCGNDVMIPSGQEKAVCQKCGTETYKEIEPPNGTQHKHGAGDNATQKIDFNYLLTHLKN